jgi:hypothetical protein
VLRFTVVRVYPTCERVGSFRVRARAGVNRVKFRGRLQGRPLAEGTYRLLVQARGTRVDGAVKLVVVREPLSRAELRRAQNANVCGLTAGATETVLGGSSRSGGVTTHVGAVLGVSVSGRGRGAAHEENAAKGPLAAAAGPIGRGAKMLGTRFAKTIEDSRPIHPLVWAVLALAILLLALAAVPPKALVTARAQAVAYRRLEVAVAGAAALAIAFFMFLIASGLVLS